TVSQGFSINASGHVTGEADITGNHGFHAFLYDGTMHDLGTLGSNTSIAYGINANDHVTGYSSSSSVFFSPEHAFLYDGVIHDIGTLPSGSSSDAYDINDNGHVVGVSSLGNGDHAFLYDGTMHDLGTLGGENSYARA